MVSRTGTLNGVADGPKSNTVPGTSLVIDGAKLPTSTVTMIGGSIAPAGKTSVTWPLATDTVPPCGPVTTATVAVPAVVSVVAVIVIDPLAPAAVTRPEELIVATLSSEDDHANVLPRIVFPFAARALALSCTVSPRERSVSAAGITTMEATAGRVGSVVSAPQPKSVGPPTNVEPIIVCQVSASRFGLCTEGSITRYGRCRFIPLHR